MTDSRSRSPPLFCAPPDDYSALPQDDPTSWVEGQIESSFAVQSDDQLHIQADTSLTNLLLRDKPLVIGVWGPSGGGKSTVAGWLASQFSGAEHISMDDFAYADRKAVVAAGGDPHHPHPFEAPLGYNKEQFMVKVAEVMSFLTIISFVFFMVLLLITSCSSCLRVVASSSRVFCYSNGPILPNYATFASKFRRRSTFADSVRPPPRRSTPDLS
jgi:hypothetical protein